jgi:hypothetical protein
MTDTKITYGKHSDTRCSRGTRARVARLLLFGLVMAFALGCERCPTDLRPATITCNDITLVVEPGTCVAFPNPAAEDGRWAGRPDFDGFWLCPTPEQQALLDTAGISIRTTRAGDNVTRELCVSAQARPFASEDINFRYGLRTQYGTGSLFLTVGRRLNVSVTAIPASVAVGQTSQLAAAVSGGAPPYFYAWSPTTWLNDTDIAAPRATPGVTTEYRVRVTDSIGQEVISDPIVVFVGMGLTATAIPPVISVDDVSVLLATAVGGTPPYTFEWSPDVTLDNLHVQNPSAKPEVTTTYHVTVTDSADPATTRHTSVTVTVGLDLTVTASPAEINPGEVSQLNAILRSGTPPYTFDWTPANTLDRPHEPNPIARPTTATQYIVLARDSTGVRQGGSVLITVGSSSPPPTASFVFNVLCCPTINLDASASTGNIVQYTWDLGWTSANPDRLTTSPTTAFTIREFDRGTITLTVTDASGRTATTTRTF